MQTAPSTTTKQHYESVLAAHYAWMFGDFDARVASQNEMLRRFGVRAAPSSSGSTAVDLGCGPGFQSLALAQLGYAVTAIDDSPTLLAELRSRATGLPITTVEADLRELRAHVGGAPVDVIVCMGDTLTHLPSSADVRALFSSAHAALAPSGLIALTFRDLTTALHGVDRIIPVRSDDDAVMTCFLEYVGDRVMVHDVIHVRTPTGWQTRKSAYPKLRVSGELVSTWLTEAGFSVLHSTTERGAVEVVARRA